MILHQYIDPLVSCDFCPGLVGLWSLVNYHLNIISNALGYSLVPCRTVLCPGSIGLWSLVNYHLNILSNVLGYSLVPCRTVLCPGSIGLWFLVNYHLNILSNVLGYFLVSCWTEFMLPGYFFLWFLETLSGIIGLRFYLYLNLLV